MSTNQIYIAQKIEISPTKIQREIFSRYFGYSRFIFNKALQKWKDSYKDFTEGKSKEKPTEWSIIAYLKQNKEDWEKELSSQVLDTAVKDVHKAFSMFMDKTKRYPTFKTKKKAKRTFRFYRKAQSTFVIIGKNKLRLTGFNKTYGLIKMKEPIREEYKDYSIQEITISEKAGRYFASFLLRLNSNPYECLPEDNNSSIGVDLGVKKFATCVDDKGDIYEWESIIPKVKPIYERIDFYQRLMNKKLSLKNKEMRENLSKRYLKAKLKLQRLHMKATNIQKQHIHLLTKILCVNYRNICIEDLRVKELFKKNSANRNISKMIGWTMFYEFREQLELKSKFYGNRIILAPPTFASSQICSCCGFRFKGKKKLKLSDRIFKCPKCKSEFDRDENAAKNLLNYGLNNI